MVGGTTCISRSTTTSCCEYRALLDAEDLAFDELEHACEEGDRTQFDKDMIDWQNALEHKMAFLANAGIELKLPVMG